MAGGRPPSEPGGGRRRPTYNRSMHALTRPLLAAGLLLALALPAMAQTQAQASRPTDPAVQPGRQNQTIERLRTEDAGSRIDELRVGGQTQSITVQPKNDMPAYEVRPSDAQGQSSPRMRVWNFLRF